MRKSVILLVVFVCSAVSMLAQQTTEGSLYAVGKQGSELGSCPLKNTAVKVDISGFISRVSVRQEFVNSYGEAIEAVYVFPLGQNGAVDAMTMTVGERVVRGKIMRREEARATYEAAKSQGRTASLLDQERTNIFTQSVANIMPGEKVIVEITYVETLKYEDGEYEFVFPMTVGPRYNPVGVKDAAKISPPIATTRNGGDISVEVNLNAGVPVEEIRSTTHAIAQTNLSPSAARITLRDEKTIPNKDFILRYDVTGKRIEDAVLTHRDSRGGFFSLILQPPDKVATEDRTPKEIVFVLDTSGSMGGFPIEKAKEAMKLSLDGLYPEDTFNIITFAGDTAILFDKPVPATQANLETAQAFLGERRGSGGTEMMKAIKAALDLSDAADHLRIVCFMTDAFIGNEDDIIAEIQRHPNARIFSFGIGSSVNGALLDKMASEGKGEVEYVGLEEEGSKAAKRFYERVRTPLLTDISVDWNGMPVADVYPATLTDLFSAKPVILQGRYTRGASGTIKLKGKIAGQPYERSINVNFPEADDANDALSTLWARTRIDELSMSRLKAADAKSGTDLDAEIANIGLEFGLLTKFTSFVAAEDLVSNPNGDPTKVSVPSLLPAGMDPSNATFDKLEVIAELQRPPSSGGGGGGGGGAGVSNLPINGRRNSQLYTANSSNAQVKTVTKSGTGSGRGQGSGSGSGNGLGSGSAGVSAVVNVTSDSSVSVDATQTQVSTTISSREIESLPKGTTFSSLLKLSPGVVVQPQPLGGGFQIDGSSASENTFIIDGSEVTSFRTGAANVGNNNASINGRAVAVAEPVYSKAAKAAKAKGEVLVNITLDLEGTVASAKAVAGNKLLRESGEAAAMLSKFAPTYVNGTPVRVTGTIAYKFKSSGEADVFLREMKAVPISPEDKRSAALATKTQFWIYQLISRLEKGTVEPTPNEGKFVRDGRADVQVKVSSSAKSVLSKLKAAGLEISGDRDKIITGRIDINKLRSLAEIEEVSLIIPKI